MSVLKVKNGNQWDIVPAIKGDPGDPAADESITDDMLVTDGIKTEIEWLWGNQLMDSREGEILHAEDAYTAPAVDISVDGKSTQVTTTGKNLLSDQIAADWVRRPAGAVVNDKWWTFIPVDDGASYHFHDTGTLGLEAGWADVTDYSSYSQIVTLTNLRNYTFTNSGNHAYLAIICSGSYTAEYIYEHIHSTSAIIESGTSFTSYEPYTGGKPSPRPDWPQDIASINDLELYQLNNKENFYAAFEWLDGYYATNGDIVASSVSMYEADYIPVSPGDILTYLYKAPTQTAAWMRFQIYDSEKTRIGATTAEISASNVEPEKLHIIKRSISQSNAAYIRISINAYQNSSKPFMHVLTLQSTAPSLLPDGYSLRSLPDGTKDELHLSYLRPSKRAGWAWYSRELVKRVGEVDLGTLSWGKYSQDNTFFTNISGIYRRYLGALCTAYKQVEGGVDTLTNGTFTTSSGGNTSVWFRNDSYTIKENFKAAVSGVMFNYILATPTTETLDPIELPIMPSQTVNVWSDPATNLKMTYIQDSNLIIENLEATIADIATS